jgi:hypothetical protein
MPEEHEGLLGEGALRELWQCLEDSLEALRVRERAESSADAASVSSAAAADGAPAPPAAVGTQTTRYSARSSGGGGGSTSSTSSTSSGAIGSEAIGAPRDAGPPAAATPKRKKVSTKRIVGRFAVLIQAYGISQAFSKEASAALVRFCSANAVVLNEMVRVCPSYVTGMGGAMGGGSGAELTSVAESPLRFLVEKPKCRIFLDFDNKRTLFRHALDAFQKRRVRAAPPQPGPVEMSVSRARVLEDSYHHVSSMRRATIPLFSKFAVAFRGEEGIDAGGLTREWYSILAQQIFNPGYALFTPAADSPTFQPNPESSVNREHLGYFKFVGFVVGKALLDHTHFDAPFNTSFYKHLLGRRFVYSSFLLFVAILLFTHLS